MAVQVIDDPVYLDPRVRRTRQMLVRALEELLSQKPFENISVGDIAEAATLNRATFYAHFVDKFDLLEDMVAARFQDLLARRGVVFDGTCGSAIYGIALAVCDFLAGLPFCSAQRQVEQHMELTMVKIVRGMIEEGLRRHAVTGAQSLEMIAAALAGAIYASAKQWVRMTDRRSAEEAATSITQILAPILAS